MVINPFSLEGKSILITGASSGIGRAIAVACSQMGALLTLTGRNEKKINETLSLLENSDSHRYVIADLSVQNDVDNISRVISKLDGVVHAAGVGSRVFCNNIAKKDLDFIMNPNFYGPILLQSSLLQHKLVKKSASIVFIASKAAQMPCIGNAVYSASKGAVISYAQCLALELAARQIRVNCICPAMVWTDLILQNGLNEEDLKANQLEYPLKRYGQPEDIAHLAVYLLSNASSWMTASCIDITGGSVGILK